MNYFLPIGEIEYICDMRFEYDGEKLSKIVRTKRIIDLKIDLRDAAKQIGTSPATLHRIEKSNTPDATTLASVCNWIGIPMEEFFNPVKEKK